MAQLLYKTRGESSPDRKQKVYFCAHPDDYPLLDNIAAEVLKHQNCAVWYDKEPDAQYDAEEFGSRLAEMQLFVMPVTTRLLTQPCRAMEFEFALAQREHIPVLPLMQESGLDELFNEKCGDLQYLDKNSTDTTGITYEEKLRKYLEAVLVGDEEAQRIRDAFAAYIFLSYRKKDRAQAQRLMRLIHQVDFCRDVAIWYDEFLTPGENFTSLISEYLEKSSLFALAVTPNLLERKNYVMRIEYPMARKLKKAVLPAVLQRTSRWKLRRKYRGIPACVDAQDQRALTEALSEKLGDVTKMRNDSPQQLYLMGLAYLNGVDVERDNDKALELISASAEQDYVEALKKLVQMYREGLGVERDYIAAVEWQRRLVSVLEKLYAQSGSEYDAHAFFNALWDLGDYLYELRRVKEAGEAYSRMLEASRGFVEKFDSNWARRDLSISYNNLGDISAAAGDPAAAKEYYQKGLEIALAIAEESDTIEARRDLSVSYNKLGDISADIGDPAAANEYYQKDLEIALAIAEESDTIQARRGLSISYNKLGNISAAAGDPAAAKEYYQKSLGIRLAIAQESDTIEARRDLSISYEKLGDISAAAGDPAAAKEYYQKGLEIRLAIAEESRTIEARRDLSISYNKLGNISAAAGDPAAAKEYYQKGLEIFIAIAQESDTIEARRDLSISYEKLGNISAAAGDPAAAKEYYQKSLGIRLAIAEESDTIQARRDLSVSYNKLGNISEAAGDPAAAKEYYQKDLEIVLAIAEESRTIEAIDDLAVSYCKLGVIDKDNLDLAMLRKAYDIWWELSARCPGVPEYARRRDIVGDLLDEYDE